MTATAELPQCPINVDGLRLADGRLPTELAVMVPIGCIELVMFVPTEEVLQAFADLAGRLELQRAEQEARKASDPSTPN